MLTKVAAMKRGARGIRVNAIALGLVDEFVANTTLGHFAHADERAGLAASLASDEASFISAGLFGIDGGAVTKQFPDLPGAFTRLTGL